VARVVAGHQATPRRGADSGTRVVTCETHSLDGHLVDARRPKTGLSVATQVAIAQIIGHDVDDVGFVRKALFVCRRQAGL